MDEVVQAWDEVAQLLTKLNAARTGECVFVGAAKYAIEKDINADILHVHMYQ